MQLGVLMSGTVITEQIFSWPGLGSLTLQSVQAREYNIVSGCVIVMAIVFVVSNLCVDILYRVFDPRVRLT
jgi:peptide/nickel transport system permease protein